MRSRRLHVTMALLLAIGARVDAQLATGVVAGRVIGPDGRGHASASIVLLDTLGHPVRRVSADEAGRFRILVVPTGRYEVQAEAPGLRSASRRIVVADGFGVDTTLELSPQRAESVTVGHEMEPSATSGTTLAAEAVQRTASARPGGALRHAVAATPGWTSEDNGLLHFRGADDGVLFVVDGVPVYERLDPQFASLDPLLLGSVRVLSGHIPAEYGLRAGGVVEVRSPLEDGAPWSAVARGGAGGQGTQNAAAVLQGPMGNQASVTLGLAGERSHRFLDPVDPGNRHNRGATAGSAAQVVWTPRGHVLSVGVGTGGASLEVPLVEEATGDPRQKLRQGFATLNWQRAWSVETASQVAVFARASRARLLGDELQAPLFTEADRTHHRGGLLAAVTHQRGAHRLKAGLEWSGLRLEETFRFVVADSTGAGDLGLSAAARAHGPDNPFDFEGRVRRPIESLYVQDAWRPTRRLTLEIGLRYDRSRLLLAESQLSPRAGASFELGPATVRTSVNRFFQPPQTEFLLLSSSAPARALSPFAFEPGSGGADIPAERQTAVEAGCDLRIAEGVRLDVAIWRRSIVNQGDPNLFFGTTILFPNSVAEGHARGLDARLEMRRRGGLSGYVSYTLAHVEQVGPINGGLFLEDGILEIGSGTRFTPDHDQRHALSAALTYENPRLGSRVTLSARHRTGVPLEVDEDELEELAGRPGGDLIDGESERTRPYTVVDLEAGQTVFRRQTVDLSLRAALLNVTGARYAFNFGNPFSGTHFGAPRTLRVEMRLGLRDTRP